MPLKEVLANLRALDTRINVQRDALLAQQSVLVELQAMKAHLIRSALHLVIPPDFDMSQLVEGVVLSLEAQPASLF